MGGVHLLWTTTWMRDTVQASHRGCEDLPPSLATWVCKVVFLHVQVVHLVIVASNRAHARTALTSVAVLVDLLAQHIRSRLRRVEQLA
eukprot:EC793512.1.p2 GENE.EC793512.1~~EC793512.1.p2  ORF type:complete len:98 (-),score=32.31 EC793512.1:57-320(-)